MKINQKIINHLTILTLGAQVDFSESGEEIVSGAIELDIDNHQILYDMIVSLIQAGQTNIVINFSNVIYIDSSAIGSIYDCHRKVMAKNGNMILTNLIENAIRTMRTTKVYEKIDIYNTVEEAVSKCIG